MIEVCTMFTWKWHFVNDQCHCIFGLSPQPNSHEFENLSAAAAILSNPVLEVFSNYFVEFVILFLAYIATPVLYYSSVVWLPAFLSSDLCQVSNDYAYDVALVSNGLSIVFTAISGRLADKFGIYSYLQWGALGVVLNTIICYTVISTTSSVVVISVCQIALSLNTFGGMGLLLWAAMWIPDPRIRNTLTGITYNLGMALFISTLFDTQTYLASLSTSWGALFAGLYALGLTLLSIFAIMYGEKCHSWPDCEQTKPHSQPLESNTLAETEDVQI